LALDEAFKRLAGYRKFILGVILARNPYDADEPAATAAVLRIATTLLRQTDNMTLIKNHKLRRQHIGLFKAYRTELAGLISNMQAEEDAHIYNEKVRARKAR
jgi:hypothetical protein